MTRGGEGVVGRGVPITSGNTLTTVTAVHSLERVAARTGLDLGRSRVAVVGATGAIGRLAALMLARLAGEIVLVGNSGNPHSKRLLQGVSDELYATLVAPRTLCTGELSTHIEETAWRLGITRFDAEEMCSAKPEISLTARFESAFEAAGRRTPVERTTDIDAALGSADVVLVATSSEMVDPRRLRRGTVLCDVSRPPNVAKADLHRLGVLAYDGGLVRPPSPVDLGPMQILPTNLCWGCLGETMLLALEDEIEDYSIGSKLCLRQADYIAALARKHGFEPAEPQWYGTLLTDGDFTRVNQWSIISVNPSSFGRLTGADLR